MTFRRLQWIMLTGILGVMLIGFAIGFAPFLFDEGTGCADPRGSRYRGLYTTGSTLCRESGGTATRSTCRADGRWNHEPVPHC